MSQFHFKKGYVLKIVLWMLLSIILFAQESVATDTPLIQSYLVKKLIDEKDFEPNDRFIQELQQQPMSNEQLVAAIFSHLDTNKANQRVINLFDNQKLLQQLPFSEKLAFFKAMQEAGVENRYQIFTLYRVLSHGYMWVDASKELRLEIESIDYYMQHYEEYKDLIIDNEDRENHLQPDIYGEVMILAFKEDIKDTKLLESYITKMREFERVFQKDITNHSMQTLITTIADKRIEQIDQGIAKRLKEEYAHKVAANKKMLYTLVVTNYSVATYIFIAIELDAKYAPLIVQTLRSIDKLAFSSEFRADMKKEEIVQKILQKYGLPKKDLKILQIQITIKDVKIA